MSTYTSQEENIILKDNDEILDIDLERNHNMKVLIIDNLPNLEMIIIRLTDGLYISISNCEKLKIIITSKRLEELIYGSYFYLGENLKSLKLIDSLFFKTLKIADEIFDKLKSLNLVHVKNLICNFKNFPKLNKLNLDYVNTSNLIVNLETIKFFIISNCLFENIELIGKNNMDSFELLGNKYKSIKTEHPIKTKFLDLYDKDKFIHYIPLSDDIDDVLNFHIDIDNLYDSEYKFFIERNLSKINIIDEDYEDLTLDDMKFNIPQKKRAR